jgi:hypothetical protein
MAGAAGDRNVRFKFHFTFIRTLSPSPFLNYLIFNMIISTQRIETIFVYSRRQSAVERQNVALAGVFLPRLSLKSEVFIFAH